MTNPTPTIPQQIEALSRQVTGLSDAVTALTTRLADLTTRLTAVEQRPMPDVTGATAQATAAQKVAQEALAATKSYSALVTEVKNELARIAGMTDGIAPLARRVTALEERIADVGGNAEPPVIPPDLTPLYDSLNEVREALGMARVGQGGEAEAPAATPEDSADAVAAADQAVSTVATAAEDRAAPLPAHLRRLLDGAGLTTDTLIARATDDELLAISGIGGELLKAIRTEIPAQDAQKDGE